MGDTLHCAQVKDGPAVAKAKTLGIHPEVNTELMGLTTLLPHAVGSPFRQHQPDALHVMPKVRCRTPACAECAVVRRDSRPRAIAQIFQTMLRLVDHVAGHAAGHGRRYRYKPRPTSQAIAPEP